jgi:hypothetical protein
VEKNNNFGQGGCAFGSSSNGFNSFNGLILNWCIGGCWFTPTAIAIMQSSW